MHVHGVSVWTVDDLATITRAGMNPYELRPSFEPGFAEDAIGDLVWERSHGIRKRILAISELLQKIASREQHIALTATPAFAARLTVDSAMICIDESLAESAEPGVIQRENGARIVTVTANARGSAPIGLVTRAMNRSLRDPTFLPPGTHVVPRGDIEQFLDAVSKLGAAMLLSAGGIYCILAILYRSYRLPLVIMTTVPLACAGAFGTLYALNVPHRLFPGAPLFANQTLNRRGAPVSTDRDDDVGDHRRLAAAGARSHGRRRRAKSVGHCGRRRLEQLALLNALRRADRLRGAAGRITRSGGSRPPNATPPMTIQQRRLAGDGANARLTWMLSGGNFHCHRLRVAVACIRVLPRSRTPRWSTSSPTVWIPFRRPC